MLKQLCALGALTLAILPPCAASASARAGAAHRAAAQSPALYSRQARRRAATLLQLKLLELREERLERVRAVILKHLNPSTLFDDRPAP